jgi:hypothetical protein
MTMILYIVMLLGVLAVYSWWINVPAYSILWWICHWIIPNAPDPVKICVIALMLGMIIIAIIEWIIHTRRRK